MTSIRYYSVAFFPNIPSCVKDTFFSGCVIVTLKDKVLQPSNTKQHTAELIKIIMGTFSSQLKNARVIVITSDGGPDHRLIFLSVQVAMIAFFQSTWTCL